MKRHAYLLGLFCGIAGLFSAKADTVIVADQVVNGDSFAVNPPVLVVSHASNPKLSLVNGVNAAWDGATVVGAVSGELGRLEILSGSRISNQGNDVPLNTYDGITVYGGMGYVGLGRGATGVVKVSGSGSLWSIRYSLSVGMLGNGTLNIEDGGRVTSNGTAFIATDASAVGFVTVTGASSRWVTADLEVGTAGTGTLEVTQGGEVFGANGAVGKAGSGKGSVSVSGTSSKWNMTGNLTVGSSGTGNVEIADAGSVSNFLGTVGSLAGSKGEVTVSSGGEWKNQSNLNVGNYGQGTLEISSSGTVTSSAGRVGIQTQGKGEVTVRGVGSRWTNTKDLVIGDLGQGKMVVAEGGVVSNTEGALGAQQGGSGEVLVTGRGSMWISTSHLKIGKGGVHNTLTIEDEALVKVGSTSTDLLAFSHGDNVLRIDNGYLAVFGDQVDYLTQLIETGNIQLWSGEEQVLSGESGLSVTFYDLLMDGEGAAFEATGYAGLGGYTVVTVIPEASSLSLMVFCGLGFAGLACFRRRRRMTIAQSELALSRG